jgi:leader peptidase (prepilin peptidase)/N-methyltransferase
MYLTSLSSLPIPVQVALFALIGLLVGSFLNVAILRIPKRLKWDWTDQCSEWLKENPKNNSERPPSIVHCASHCPNCKTKIKPWHNIPIFGYLLLQGRCASCKKPISIRYALFEAITALCSGIVIWHFGITIEGIFAIILTWTLIVQTGIDIDHQLLLDEISLPVMWLGLILSLVPVFANPIDSILGAAIGYMSLWSIYQLFKLLTGKEGMGYGDFKLLALLGAWFGWQYLPQIVLISTFLGSIIGISLIISKKLNKEKPIPFGPYLAIAGWIAMIWGDQINRSYFQFIT